MGVMEAKPIYYNWQAQDHLLGVVVKLPSGSNKQHIVFMLKPHLPSTVQSPPGGSNLQDKRSADFSEGYMLVPKSKRAFEEEYCSSVTSRKGSGAINIKLPYHGSAAGMGFEVREVDIKEFVCICNRKIKIDQVRLLEVSSSVAFSQTVQQLVNLKSDGNKFPPALDPVKGMTIS